jgi:nucleoside-diphosphate-sugar epimerase
MRILVTGGSGFIGTNLINKLTGGGYEVLNMDVCEPRLKTHIPLWRKISLLDLYAMSQLVAEFQPDYVVHAAARTDLRGKTSEDYVANTTGTSNLVTALDAAATIKRVIFISSMLVCRNGYTPTSIVEYCPDTIYGESKAEMEILIRTRMDLAGREYVIVRPTSVWGPWFGEPYLQFFLAIRRGLYVHPGNGQVNKQFAYVGNVVDQIERLLVVDAVHCSGSVFYLGDYAGYIVRDWANLIQKELRTKRIRTIPLTFLKAIATVGDSLMYIGWTRVPLTSFRLSNMLKSNILDSENTARVCGPLNHSVADGVRETVAWIKTQGI